MSGDFDIDFDEFDRVLAALQELLRQHVHVGVMAPGPGEAGRRTWASVSGVLGMSLARDEDPETRWFFLGYPGLQTETGDVIATGQFRVARADNFKLESAAEGTVILSADGRTMIVTVAPPLVIPMPDEQED